MPHPLDLPLIPVVSFRFGRKLIELHDEQGIPLAISLEMAHEQNLRPALVGILAEIAARGWGPARLREAIGAFQSYFVPTDIERQAIAVFQPEQS